MHVLYTLAGNAVGFMDEFSVSFKSVLLNNPLDRNLTIHIMANEKAYKSVIHLLTSSEEIGLFVENHNGFLSITENQQSSSYHYSSPWRTRNQISIVIYRIRKERISEWKQQLNWATNTSITQSYGAVIHTIGTYFRLFASDVLLPMKNNKGSNYPSSSWNDNNKTNINTSNIHITNLVYLDTDVAIIENLEGLWRQVVLESSNDDDGNDGYRLFLWGESKCAGFLVIPNLKRFGDELWNLILNPPIKTRIIHAASALRTFEERNNRNDDKDDYAMHMTDQVLLRLINEYYPRRVGTLPPEWDTHLAEGPWRWITSGEVLSNRPKLGMVHYNGGGRTTDNAFLHHQTVRKRSRSDNNINKNGDGTNDYLDFEKTWQVLASYYANLPWSWTRSILESQITITAEDDKEDGENNNAHRHKNGHNISLELHHIT